MWEAVSALYLTGGEVDDNKKKCFLIFIHILIDLWDTTVLVSHFFCKFLIFE